MSRRLPNCAWCGTPLAKRTGRTILEYGSLPGHPSIGWCFAESGNCDRLDDAANGVWKRLKHGPVEPLLTEIAARGPGRVVRNKTRHARGIQP